MNRAVRHAERVWGVEPTDLVIQCVDCPATFTFTAGEAGFFAEHGFSDPTRCPDCRKKRRDRMAAAGAAWKRRETARR